VRCLTALAILPLVGCGRLGFSPEPARGSDDGGSVGGLGDAPPVPAAICHVARLPVAPAIPTMTDLVVAPTSEGYAVMWTDPRTAGPAAAALLSPQRELLGSFAVPSFTATQLGGLADVGQQLALASATGGAETTWTVARDLSAFTPHATLSGHVMGHNPWPSDTAQSPRVFMTAIGPSLVMAYVDSAGQVSPQANVFAANGPISTLACNDGPTHAHCVWAEQLTGGGSQCTATDVLFSIPTMPQLGGREVLSSDCDDLRNASGPDPADSMIIAWTTDAGGIEARYIVSTGNVSGTIAPAGSAPRVAFDGTRFWIAWLDGQSELQLSSFELDGTITPHPLPGWKPAGPQAFEMVRRADTTSLVMMSASELDVLTLCD
jgi:hypothetical protein